MNQRAHSVLPYMSKIQKLTAMNTINLTFRFSRNHKIIFTLFILTGIAALIYGIIYYSPEKIWSTILLNNINLLTIALGGVFFISVHIMSQAGWHTTIQRIPEAIGSVVPVAAILMLITLFGITHIFHWIHEIHTDPVIQAKKAFLNVPFFIARLIIYLAIWLGFSHILRKLSVKNDSDNSLKYFNKSRVIASLFIVFFAISIVIFSWDWLMSVEAHWYSTLFGWYVLAGIIVKCFAVILLIIAILKSLGYLDFVNKEHLHDLAKYLFSFSIFWMYLWFSQYMLIWYSNIPEETIYFIKRIEDYKILFFGNLVLNFGVPFLILLFRYSRRNIWILAFVSLIIIIGQWIDQYLMIFPGTQKHAEPVGLFEIGISIGYLGILLWVVFHALSKVRLLPKNHPFLNESFNYENL